MTQTLPEKMQALIAIKAALKEALESRGIDMTDVPFNQFSAKIRTLYPIDFRYSLSKLRLFEVEEELLTLPSGE